MTIVDVRDVPTSRSATIRYRDQLVSYLRTRGLPVGKPLLPPRGAFADDCTVRGIKGWTVLVRRQRTLDFSGALDLAHARAEAAGNEHAAVVLHRVGRDIEEAYALVSVSTLATLLGADPSIKPEGTIL